LNKIFAFIKKVWFNMNNILNHTFFIMNRKLIQYYYDFFDKRIENSTLVVWLIGTMIFLAWFLSNTWASYKSNVLEYKNMNTSNTVIIDGKKYKIIFEEMQ